MLWMMFWFTPRPSVPRNDEFKVDAVSFIGGVGRVTNTRLTRRTKAQSFVQPLQSPQWISGEKNQR